MHISARLAWHMDGWNGHICKNPSANTYCIGQFSYPGNFIYENRDLEWEKANCGVGCSSLDKPPPCMYSVNAFGADSLRVQADPPSFFPDETRAKFWNMLPATVGVWPYEEMYTEEVKDGQVYNYDKRLAAANEYFDQINEDQSLIFYYSNYSNPFSEEDRRSYVVVGLSRVKKVGEGLFYENCSEETQKRFGGGFVWQRNITSHYPDQGLRLPYHQYVNNPDILQQFLFYPDNPRNFKYGTRHISDDDALDLVERFLEFALTLKYLGDTSEDWSLRIDWLQSLVAELWKNRGLYPGLGKVLDYLGFTDAIPFLKSQVNSGKEQVARDAIFGLLDGNRDKIDGLEIDHDTKRKIARRWLLKEDDERDMLRDLLPRFDLHKDQIGKILSNGRAQNGIYSSLPEISANPYILSEEFTGDDPDDIITFNKIDHGVFPSPDLGGTFLCDEDDWKRLRGLCVERLRREEKHAFMSATQVINDINHKLSLQPEWKRHQYSESYLEVDKDELSQALFLREEGGKKYLYLKSVFDDEREIERQLRALAQRPNIPLRSPVTEQHWHTYLYDSDSSLAERNPSEYDEAIQGQVDVCQKIFPRPICILTGSAGTGKTTVIRALIQAIEKAHGTGTAFQLLAPTGKATERIREKTEKSASTIHSFLARHGWLNDNMTYKRIGGTREESASTYIIDEASMLDLGLMAALFRSINWNVVQRLVLVGDLNQLPPIGRGKILAGVFDWLQEHQPECVGFLETNIRQMENRLKGRGMGILDLASLYTRARQEKEKDQTFNTRKERILRAVQEGGAIDQDLRIVYWNDPEDLEERLKEQIISDMEEDSGLEFDEERPFELWSAAFEGRPEYQQVISPYRGDQFGTDNLNLVLQNAANARMLNRVGHLAQITLFDKVIQFRNRPRSNPIWSFNRATRQLEQIEVYNGELGFVKPHGFDRNWRRDGFYLDHFQVVFSRKQQYWVGYGNRLGKTRNGYWLPSENPEENLELGYAISVHKSQGSEFDRIYLILPKYKQALLSTELFYTAITRASRHCTVLIQEDVGPLFSMLRLEKSHLLGINSSLFTFLPVPEEILSMYQWYEEGKIHKTLTDYMVRSKSEVIIANMLFERDIPFKYEKPLYASDGTFYLPDFTVTWQGEEWYWEHLGRMDQEGYRNHWDTKKAWYDNNFKGRLVTTEESTQLSRDSDQVILRYFS